MPETWDTRFRRLPNLALLGNTSFIHLSVDRLAFLAALCITAFPVGFFICLISLFSRSGRVFGLIGIIVGAIVIGWVYIAQGGDVNPGRKSHVTSREAPLLAPPAAPERTLTRGVAMAKAIARGARKHGFDSIITNSVPPGGGVNTMISDPRNARAIGVSGP